MNEYEEWRQFVQKVGSVMEMPYEALRHSCPKCGKHKGYTVTGDGYAYCNACGWGTRTEYRFTSEGQVIRLDRDGKVQS